MQSIGRYLRNERELRRLSLEELAQTTRIPRKSLAHIEADDFDSLPGDVFTRGFLTSYSRALGVAPDPVLARFEEAKDASIYPTALGNLDEPDERGRRLGVAVAMVILLFLFTLALSIVLRPRRHDRPAELSQHTQPTQVSPVLGSELTAARPEAARSLRG